MGALQTVAMGLVIVFLDIGPSGWDWVADPIGWVLVLVGLAALKEILPNYRGLAITGWVCLGIAVLTWTPDSIAKLGDGFGWVFSLPTVAFCVLLCTASMAVVDEPLARRFDALRWALATAAALPLLVFGPGWGWLTIPSTVLVVLTNVVLVFTLWSAGDEDPPAVEEPEVDRTHP
jgi:hypothetical protein